MRTTTLHWVLVVGLALMIAGCDEKDKDLDTIRGLQEENRVLKKQVEDLKSEKEKLEIRLAEDKSSAIQSLKETHEQEKSLWQQKNADLIDKNADLSVQWGKTHQQNLLYKNLADQNQYIEPSNKEKISWTIWSLVAVIIIILGFLSWVAHEWLKLRTHYLSLVQRAISLQKRGHNQ